MNSPLRSAIKFCAVTMILISIVGCQKENLDAPTTISQEEPPVLLQLDSIVSQSIELDQLKRIPFETAQKKAMLREGKTIIISGAFNLGVFTTLDFYFARDQIEQDRRYTSIVTPINGNPNLSARSYKASRVPPYRMIRSNYTNTSEMVSFTKTDLLPSEHELNFVVQGSLGTTFKWEIYSEIIVEPDLTENVLNPCICGQEVTETIICENFENMTAGLISGQTDDLVSLDDRNTLDAVVVKQAGFGLNSESALMLLDAAEPLAENQLNTEVNINLGDEKNGTFLFSWSILIPVNGTAEFDAPAFGGKFKLEGNGRGTLNLFDRYTLNLNYPSGEWLPLELGYEPHRGLYRIKIQDKIYYWLVSGADNTLDYFRLYGTPSGYRIDNICFERYVD